MFLVMMTPRAAFRALGRANVCGAINRGVK
jgi:hypothetical protein